jgi:hypothetical protein
MGNDKTCSYKNICKLSIVMYADAQVEKEQHLKKGVLV